MTVIKLNGLNLNAQISAATEAAQRAVEAMLAAVDISNIDVPDEVVEALVKGTGGAGPLTREALSRYSDTLVPLSRFGVVGDGVTDDTTKLHEALASGEKLFIPRGFNVAFDGPLITHVGDMIVGAGFTESQLTYLGSADSWAIDHDVAVDDQYPGRVVLADFALFGDGNGSFGAGATVNGIRSGDIIPGLRNVPFYSVHRVRMLHLRTGMTLEGYGHHIQETHARLCEIGFDLVHPEQVMVLNSWADYCDVGLRANVRKNGTYGHRFHIVGGAYQRCQDAGIWLQNLYEPVIDTYFELNGNCDIRFGAPTEPENYTKGVKNAQIHGTFTGTEAAVANIDAYASTSSRVFFENTSGADMTVPHVRLNGYCKNWEIEYGEDSIHTSYNPPFEFQGNSIHTSWAHPRAGRESKTPTLTAGLVGVTDSATSPLRYYKSAADEVVLEGSWEVGASYSGGPTILTLPVGYRPFYQRTFQVPMFAGSWQTATIQIDTNGQVRWQNGGGISRSVYLGNLRFRTAQIAY